MSAPVPAWLTSFCSTDTEFRSDLTEPHTLTWRGEPAVAATNGHKMVIVPGTFDATPFGPAIASSIPGIVETVLQSPARAVRLSALREFAGVVPEPELCGECSGKGVLVCAACGGDGEQECECDCGHEHETDCEVCNGTGDMPCPRCIGARRVEFEPVWIGDDHFNRWLVASVVRALPTPPNDAPVTWHSRPEKEGTHYAGAIVGDGWVAILMPMRPESYEVRGTFDAWERSEVAA
jgi:hypothetical protein